ncbi:UDP-glucose/GDP-mannose dehydrogenase family protein [Schumannella luteola]|uniref:UDP-glucose 6-dehydrogenase n=1 Tax=Schumannella luteola TaxID=472059 RepID=A0A852YG91_9MICO|nr:UDP-glucose/GDP-mannose dehydrogenase family protein [Schumannella luteola]NYH00301.1 UDPglucose 6-dehydrogenase [Schumannella luteola]TPX06009.1 UDP-glucose/GDP-mannose dehydrogenase family protein [Schumannella luteola]
MRISVIGCGYLGAVHAAAMASQGHDVIGIDVDPVRLGALREGRVPFHEPGLEQLLSEGMSAGRLRFSTEIADAATAQVHFVAVNTPQRLGGDEADLGYVEAALRSLAPHLAPGALVVGKSTVPVGTARRLAPLLAGRAELVWNPEFLREGHAIDDTLRPDRLVYGVGDEPESAERARVLLDEVYAPQLATGVPRIVADRETAELVKVSANAFLALKISFINAVADVCAATGADVNLLADAIGHDARIGRRFLGAGLGFGGGCLPKDIRAFGARAAELGEDAIGSLLREADRINLGRRHRAVELLRTALSSQPGAATSVDGGGDLRGRRIAVLGLAFKPDSDDIRDSPALSVATELALLGAEVVAHDPHAVPKVRIARPELTCVDTADEAVVGADAVLVLTEWREYRELDPAALAATTPARLVLDARNCLDPAAWRAAGWDYRGLGRHEQPVGALVA